MQFIQDQHIDQVRVKKPRQLIAETIKSAFKLVYVSNMLKSYFRVSVIIAIDRSLRAFISFLLCIREQYRIGFPVCPSGQEHWAWWRATWHRALTPHCPTQGSLHFWPIQARWLGQSLFAKHSGRQLGSDPRKVGRHEQTGVFFADTAHRLFGPQGVGLHGFVARSFWAVSVCQKKKEVYL